MSLKRLTLAAVLTLVSACGGGEPEPGAGGSPTATVTMTTASPTSTPGCAASGTELEIEAENIRFDKTCLAAPASTPFTLRLKNRDVAKEHTFAIYRGADGSDPLFQGERVLGPAEKTYNVSAIPAGKYFFRCDVHPAVMKGQFFTS
jgi:cupredoxin-like protein